MLVRLRLASINKDSCGRDPCAVLARACTCTWCDEPAMNTALQLKAIYMYEL